MWQTRHRKRTTLRQFSIRHHEPPIRVWLELHTDHEPRRGTWGGGRMHQQHWIPAFAGMTSKSATTLDRHGPTALAMMDRRPQAGESVAFPARSAIRSERHWIPAFAGMTSKSAASRTAAANRHNLSAPRLRRTWMCKCRGCMDAHERPAFEPTYDAMKRHSRPIGLVPTIPCGAHGRQAASLPFRRRGNGALSPSPYAQRATGAGTKVIRRQTPCATTL